MKKHLKKHRKDRKTLNNIVEVLLKIQKNNQKTSKIQKNNWKTFKGQKNNKNIEKH